MTTEILFRYENAQGSRMSHTYAGVIASEARQSRAVFHDIEWPLL